MTKETKEAIKSNQNQRLFVFWFVVVASLLVSTVFVQMFLGGGYFDFYFINPFDGSKQSKEYISNSLWLPLFMVSMTILIYLFHFGNPKRKYIKALDKARRKLFNFIPFYFDGRDVRNNYIKFGFQETFKNAFLERKIHTKDYLQKVSHLSVFVDDYSPDLLFNTSRNKKKNNFDIKSTFLSDEYYFELFRIIEHLLLKNVDEIEDIPLDKYRAIGGRYKVHSLKNISNYIKDVVPKEKNKFWRNTRSEALGMINKLFSNFKEKKIPTSKQAKHIENFLNRLKIKNGYNSYVSYRERKIIFSPLALSQYIKIIEEDARKYYKNIVIYRARAYHRLNEHKRQDMESVFNVLKFVVFYKVINQFMGLPSGIVTARLDDYDWKRIIDDIDHCERIQSVRQIKKGVNDDKGNFNDIFTKIYMTFHFEFFRNSANSKELEELFERFNPLPDIEAHEDGQEASQLFATLSALSEEEK